MDVLTLARVMLRRWYVVVLVMLATAAAIVFVGFGSGPPATTDGSMLIAQPDLQSVDAQEGVPTSASDVAAPSVLAAAMTDEEIVERVVDDGGSARYTVTPTGEEGLLRITGIDDTEQGAVDTVDLVLAELQAEAENRQEEADIPSDERISVTVLAAPAAAIPTAVEGDVLYEASGTARLSGRFGTENPYRDPDFAFAILREVVMSDQGRTALTEAGATAEFEMRLDESILRLSVTGDGVQAADETYATLTDELAAQLEQRQAAIGIPSTQRTRLQPLAEPLGATPDRSSLVRPLLTIAILGGVAAVGLALLADNAANALAAARDRRTGGSDDERGGRPASAVLLHPRDVNQHARPDKNSAATTQARAE